MDFIINKLNKKIELYSQREDFGNLKLYLQVKVEYELILVMAYLWNKNLCNLDKEKQSKLYQMVSQPSIGEIVSIIRNLDIEKEISKKLKNIIDSYPAFRNEKIGHGYSFEDDNSNFIISLKEIIEKLDTQVSVLSNPFCIVNIEKKVDGILHGMLFNTNGDYNNWMQREYDCKLDKGVYLTYGNKYFKISPFIYIEEEQVYTFRSIKELMIGKFLYNKLFETSTLEREWDDFKNISIQDDGYKKITINNTIVNKFENNYSSFQYIETHGIQKKIDEFIKNKSCVYATLWGHGGVGKTAAVQNYCEKLGTDKERRFEYILFVSAKDRLYDSYTGTIKSINNNTTYSTIIKNLNKLILNNEAFNEEAIVSINSKVLLIIDDFETFSNDDKRKIEEFVRKLDINNHKVLITTRSNSILGEEIKTNELDCEGTIKFLIEIYKALFKTNFTQKLDEEKIKKIHQITSGRPLFILQFAHVCSRNGIDVAISNDIKSNKDAIEFLYGRIYDYLNTEAQKIFCVLGVLADSDDLTNLLDKVKYILNMESDDKFNEYLDEIEKLRLIEIIDNKFYKIYSNEICDIMKSYFEKMDDNSKKTIRSKIQQISKDRNLDNDHALLENANASKYSKSEQEVVGLFQSLIKRKNTKREIRIKAILSVSEYLFNDRGNKDVAIQKLTKYYNDYNYCNESSIVKMYATYLWADGQNEDSVKVLLNFFSVNPNMKDDNVLELFGLLVTYRSLYCLALREETKQAKRFDEIYDEDYKKQIREQTQDFKSIKKNQGDRLVNLVKELDFQKISSGARQNLITAVYQYVEICIRICDWQTGEFLCSYVQNKLSNYNYGLNFKQKMDRILRYRKQNLNKPKYRKKRIHYR